jgi:hypothetical protein
MKFDFVYLGQTVLKYQVPLEIFVGLNEIYEKQKKQLPKANKSINSIWVNEMKAHEYNPVHIHQGKLYTGLSSVMIMKLPKDTGVEYSAESKPMNGRLQIIGAANGQFSKTDYSPNMKIGDFYVFPYDMRHCVYPFNGTKETRRTLVCNVDIDYNPVASRTGSGQNE